MDAPPSNLKDRLRASYNSVAEEYNTWTESHHNLRLKYLEKLYEHAPDLLSSDALPQVLELGSGAGLPVAKMMLESNPNLNLVANDLSDVMMDLAKKNLADFGDRVKCVPGDMTAVFATATSADMLSSTSSSAYHILPSSLSAVVALYSIIHLPQSEQRTMLERIASWLKPGTGCLMGSFAGGKEAPGHEVEKWMGKDDWMYWSGLGSQGTVKLLEELGMEVLVKEKEMEDGSEFLWVVARKRGDAE